MITNESWHPNVLRHRTRDSTDTDQQNICSPGRVSANLPQVERYTKDTLYTAIQIHLPVHPCSQTCPLHCMSLFVLASGVALQLIHKHLCLHHVQRSQYVPRCCIDCVTHMHFASACVAIQV